MADKKNDLTNGLTNKAVGEGPTVADIETDRNRVGGQYFPDKIETGQTAPIPMEAPTQIQTQEEEKNAASRKAVTQSYWSLVKHQFKKNKIALTALYLVYFLFSVAILADLLANDKPIFATHKETTYFPVFKDYLVGLGMDRWNAELVNADWRELEARGELGTSLWPPIRYRASNQDLINNLKAPGGDHLLGTDAIGRDVLAGLIHGSRIALSVGFVSMSIALLIGIVLGAMAGFYGGWIDVVISRLIELVLTLPTFFLIITVVAMFQTGSVWLVMILIGLTGWPSIARFTRGEFLRVRNMEYVSAATALGFKNNRVIFRHVLPNALAPVLVTLAFGIAGAILTEASLSFLGFGVPPTVVTWGSVLAESRGNVSAWWLAVFPGAAIFLAVVAYNLVGDGLRDALDPRLRD
ncbi:MAG TPA: ABC transporter permease [Candidatus Kapabacteria bacterium]|nr:ABC transporter permease [Candidatus Kapabacteria bacterium]